MNYKLFNIIVLELGNKSFDYHDILGDSGKFSIEYIRVGLNAENDNRQ